MSYGVLKLLTYHSNQTLNPYNHIIMQSRNYVIHLLVFVILSPVLIMAVPTMVDTATDFFTSMSVPHRCLDARYQDVYNYPMLEITIDVANGKTIRMTTTTMELSIFDYEDGEYYYSGYTHDSTYGMYTTFSGTYNANTTNLEDIFRHIELGYSVPVGATYVHGETMSEDEFFQD